jgi:enoyl-CoA hydratase/carnithine racemase
MPEAATSPLPDDPALLRIEGPIATITLNRPEAFNSVNLAIAKKLEQLAAEVEGNDDVRVLVIEGEGRAFSAGGDLQTIGAAAAADTIAPVVGELLLHYHAFITSLRRMPKIVLSSVHGSAAGAGLSLAFVADMCIAAEDARFTPAYGKIGASPDAAAQSAWSRPSAYAARFKSFSPKTIFPHGRLTTGGWWPGLCRQPS